MNGKEKDLLVTRHLVPRSTLLSGSVGRQLRSYFFTLVWILWYSTEGKELFFQTQKSAFAKFCLARLHCIDYHLLARSKLTEEKNSSSASLYRERKKGKVNESQIAFTW